METAESITCLGLFFKDSSGGEATKAGAGSGERGRQEAEAEETLRDRNGEIIYSPRDTSREAESLRQREI